jgi:hypothetical protein
MRTFHQVLVLAPLAAGCMLEPLVDDGDRSSVYILPPGSEVPRVDTEPERVHQISVHDGLEDGPLKDAAGVVLRKTGWAGGEEVRYWSFGPAPRTGAPLYVLVDSAGVRIDHPYLLDTMPGDPGYSPFRRIVNVAITDRYRGERLTTVRALTDAIELGLVYEPLSSGKWTNLPVVPPGVTLEVGGDRPPAAPIEVYAGGYKIDAFALGGERGVQPLRGGALPTAQYAALREGNTVAFVPTPVFQQAVPGMPPVMTPNYTPLVFRVEVRLAPGVVAADEVHGDADLFTRSMTGAITAAHARVASFEITDRTENWPLQFTEGEP